MRIEKNPIENGKEQVIVTYGRRKYSAIVAYQDDGTILVEGENGLDEAFVLFALRAQEAGILDEIEDSDIANADIEIFNDDVQLNESGKKDRSTTFRVGIGKNTFHAYGEYRSKNEYRVDHADDELSFAAVWLALELYGKKRIKRLYGPF